MPQFSRYDLIAEIIEGGKITVPKGGSIVHGEDQGALILLVLAGLFSALRYWQTSSARITAARPSLLSTAGTCSGRRCPFSRA